MPSFNLYDVLELQKGASKDEIKRAYRAAAVKHHPDKGGDAEVFKKVAEAYEVLSDDDKKNSYDQFGDDGMQNINQGQPNPHDIFSQFFGGGMPPHGFPFGGGGGFPFGGGGFNFDFNVNHQQQEQKVKRQDIVHEIHIPLSEAYHGSTKNIKISLDKICFSCQRMCQTCQGKGQITQIHRMGPITQVSTQHCHACGGSGKSSEKQTNNDCATCNGNIRYTKEKKIELKIPAGVNNDKKFKYSTYGEQKQNENEEHGDLYIIIKINNDSKFEREENNLIYKQTITFLDSVIGKNITIPHFGGEFTIDIGQYCIIEPKKRYLYKNKGMCVENTHGDLYLIFDIEYENKKLNDKEKENMRNLFNSMTIS